MATQTQTTLQGLTIKTVEQGRDDFLRTYRNALINRGITNPNVSSGTEIFNRATAISQLVYGAAVAVPLAANAQMADSAQALDLVRLAKIFLKRGLRQAGPSAGPLVFTASVSSNIAVAQGQQLLDPSGLIYQVADGGSYTPGSTTAPIPLQSVSTGAATKLAAGTVLRWVSPPAFVNPTATIGVGGLTGGTDQETYEDLRTALLEQLGNPPNGVNWASLTTAIEATTPAVQKAFAYPACNGPSTEHAAAVGPPPGTTTPTGRNRDVDTLVTLPTVIIPGALAGRPEFVETVITTVVNYPVDLAIGLALPASTLASPQGPGGGWLDANPWPYYSGHTSYFPGTVPYPTAGPAVYADVTAVASSTSITVNADAAPVVGSQVCWVSTDDWQLYEATVATVVSTTPNVSIPGYSCAVTLDTPLVSVNGVAVAVGDFIFPNALNMATYVAAWLAGFAALGPGEKTSSAGLLPRAFRRPLASQSWPSTLERPFLGNFTGAGAEVTDAQFLYANPTGSPAPGVVTRFGSNYVAPPLPAAITSPPYILTPHRVAFYPV